MGEVQVILLNGASSSGKTTLAKALQNQLAVPHVYFGEDDFWSKLPERGNPLDHSFEFRYKLYYGFLHCIAALADCGNCVIVDTVADDKEALVACARLLSKANVLFVGVHCDLVVLEARELARGDRSPGTARRQHERVHTHSHYDIEVDTSTATTAECVEAVLKVHSTPPAQSAFERLLTTA
ncbi:AAA family ATPase [Armatimonas sp.]|uniref:chloramphenicol phosphotransferase CPT family protein n=1 Tax=Armatimonas sp. TaxID=1872638 RepID=UPI00286C3762|nr:AAA family ATPase [Armatimonas sp.]